MAWEQRDGPRGRYGRYYTRSRKVAGRVVREYVGIGPVAEAAAALDAARRAHRAEQAAARRAERAWMAEAEAPLAAFDGALTSLTKAALLATGYRQHQRGEWRRRKDDGDEPAGAGRSAA